MTINKRPEITRLQTNQTLRKHALRRLEKGLPNLDHIMTLYAQCFGSAVTASSVEILETMAMLRMVIDILAAKVGVALESGNFNDIEEQIEELYPLVALLDKDDLEKLTKSPHLKIVRIQDDE